TARVARGKLSPGNLARCHVGTSSYATALRQPPTARDEGGTAGSAGIAAGHRTRGKEGPMDRVSLYWKKATAAGVGDEHGVTEKELKQIAPRIKTLTKQMNDERKAGKLRYRDLPNDEDMLDAVNTEVEHFRDTGCDVLVVLGIGGSALGNIALQNALNPYTYNLMSDRQRPGPQILVLDNVDPDQLRAVVDLVT